MNNKNYSQSRLLAIFSVVWIVVTSGGVYFNSDGVVQYVLVFNVALVAVQLFFLRRFVFKKFGDGFFLLVLFFFLVLLCVLRNSDYVAVLTYARFLLVLGLAYGTSVLVSREYFAYVFVRVVVVLAFFSVVLFYSELVDSNSSFFPAIEFHDYRYVNAWVYLFFDSVERRNLSIFIEPGLYQIYLNAALFFILNSHRNSWFRRFAVVVLMLALYSTNSTTGLILGVVVIAAQAGAAGRLQKSFAFTVVKFFFVAGLVGGVLVSDFFLTNVEEKFQSDKQQSYITRQNSTLIDLILISENPIFGGGVGAYQQSLDYYDSSGLEIDAATNTFTQLGAIFGVPLIVVIFWRVLFFVRKLSCGLVGKAVFLLLYVVSFSTEPFVLYPLFYLPVFMSMRANGVFRIRQ